MEFYKHLIMNVKCWLASIVHFVNQALIIVKNKILMMTLKFIIVQLDIKNKIMNALKLLFQIVSECHLLHAKYVQKVIY